MLQQGSEDDIVFYMSANLSSFDKRAAAYRDELDEFIHKVINGRKKPWLRSNPSEVDHFSVKFVRHANQDEHVPRTFSVQSADVTPHDRKVLITMRHVESQQVITVLFELEPYMMARRLGYYLLPVPRADLVTAAAI